jgi:hypothetical protein
VRLLRGSNTDTESNEVAEVHLGQTAQEDAGPQELAADAGLTELDASTIAVASSSAESTALNVPDNVFELPTNELSTRRTGAASVETRASSVPYWLQQVGDPSRRSSIAEEGFSDAETLLPDSRSIVEPLEALEYVVGESFTFPTRSSSVFSIVKTPTRGLSVVGPVRRIEKVNRFRAKGKAARSELNRSGAHKSVKRHTPRSSTNSTPTVGTSGGHRSSASFSRDSSFLKAPDTVSSDESVSTDREPEPIPETRPTKKMHRRSSTEEPTASKSKSRLQLQTNVPRVTSANSSPLTMKRSPRTKTTATIPSPVTAIDASRQADASPVWSEVDPSTELREALDKAFGSAQVDAIPDQNSRLIPTIEEPMSDSEVGNVALPAELEIRFPHSKSKSSMATFWGLAFSALTDKAFDGLHALRLSYGSEPPVPANHVRVRWTCVSHPVSNPLSLMQLTVQTCAEPLYDDFIERRPGAARLLEAYLNRPRAHTPTSPSTRTSTATSMSSIFDSNSRASTLTTPASTYNSASSLFGGGKQQTDSSKRSPIRLGSSNNPFSVRIGTYAEEAWLLTCANEGRFTPKIVHVDVNAGRIKCDKDLAVVLREHYERINRRWLKWARLRGLATIEFVQFEVHRNRFADIRATPSMPPISSASSSSSTNEKSPSQHPYTFEPVDLVPPVGSAYLLHMFKHPEDYDGELVTYLRAPKRRERLEFGMGWGINLVEGFLAQKVWAVIIACFGIGSVVFAVVWTVTRRDVQGAFGVASWVVALAGLGMGGLQAWLE